MRSSSGRPEAWYFLAIETTRRRFDCTKVRSACSPFCMARRSSRFLAGVSSVSMLSNSAPRCLLRWPGEADLVFLRQQGVLADVSQVEPNEVFFVSFNTFLRHRDLLTLPPWSSVPSRLRTTVGRDRVSDDVGRAAHAVAVDDRNPAVATKRLAVMRCRAGFAGA